MASYKLTLPPFPRSIYNSMSDSNNDIEYLKQAVALSAQCPSSPDSYAVGCVVVHSGKVLTTGFSMEGGNRNHAEEAALNKAHKNEINLSGATLYCTMEPCSQRKSKPLSCTELILRHGIKRVVYVLDEPPLFVNCQGKNKLKEQGVEVVKVDELAEQVRWINRHLGI